MTFAYIAKFVLIRELVTKLTGCSWQEIEVFGSGVRLQVNFIYDRQGSPFSHWLVSKGALGKLQLHNKNFKIKNYFN